MTRLPDNSMKLMLIVSVLFQVDELIDVRIPTEKRSLTSLHENFKNIQLLIFVTKIRPMHPVLISCDRKRHGRISVRGEVLTVFWSGLALCCVWQMWQSGLFVNHWSLV